MSGTAPFVSGAVTGRGGAAAWDPEIGAPRAKARLAAAVTSAEDGLLAAVLGAMVLLPLVELVARALDRGGFGGSTSFVQHCTLVVSMAGAAIAAREGRLLSLGTGTLLPARIRPAAHFVAHAGAAAVAAVLGMTGVRYVMAERAGLTTAAWGIPAWALACAIPAGFTLIAIRLVAGVSSAWAGRLPAAAGAALVAGASLVDLPSAIVLSVGCAGLALLAAAGAPIFAVIGGAAILAYHVTAIPAAAMTVSHYSLVVHASLPAIPLFTLAGYVLAEGGASRRLVRLFDALLGGVRGGPAFVTVLACAFFTTFTGGSGVTILALGGLLLPILLQAQYRERDALGLVTGAAALGILFPPCLPLILYAVAAEVDARQLFLAAMVPGFLLLGLTAVLGFLQQPPSQAARRFDGSEVLRALLAAKWELLLPVVVAAAFFGGYATPVEAAAVTALYAIAIEALFYGELRPMRLVRTFVDCGLLIGGILLILGVALGLTGFLVDAEVPQRAAEWVAANVHSTVVFLLLLNVFLVVVGAMMDIYSAIVVVVPLILPLGAAFGIDPLHLGVIFLTNLELGYLVPPVGENLFIAAYRFNRPVGELARAVLPVVVVFTAAVLAVTYVPWLSLWLVGAVK